MYSTCPSWNREEGKLSLISLTHKWGRFQASYSLSIVRISIILPYIIPEVNVVIYILLGQYY